MASKYFSLIHNKLHKLVSNSKKHVEDQAKLRMNELDVSILEMFCLYLEAWESCTSDEQRKENLRCMITHLKLIWIQEGNNLETWPQDIPDFNPLTFGLEQKGQLSKPQIEQWCENLVLSSLMECKSSKNHKFRDFVKSCVKIVPFKNQFDILKDMLEFLSDSFYRVRECTDSKELLEYKKFLHAFFNNTACLVCMYWAKEENEENASETNTALFDMLHNIKPCAVHVTASYFAVLKSNNLMKEEDAETPASFVDFFFKHTLLKDVFLTLRERLIVLITFLTNAQQEEDTIRNQIYVLFREDAYLLLHISEMKKDITNKNMLLSDFISKIDILIATIIRLYCRPSDSWSRLEAEKMNNIYFASLQRELSSFKQPLRFPFHLLVFLKEIRFLRSLFFQCFETWDDSDEETRLQLSSVVTSLQRIWGQDYNMILLSNRIYAIRKGDNVADWKHLDLELKEKFQMSKQEINAWLVSLSHCSFHCRPSTSNKILKFMDSILYNMSDLITSRAIKDAAFKNQIEILEEKLLLVKNILKLTTDCSDSKNLEEFNMLAQVFANNAACLIYLYWTEGKNYKLPAKTNLMLSNMLQKIKPDTPDVVRIYIGTLKSICLQPYDSLLLEQTVVSFVDYFFEDLITPWKNDFQILRDEVIFCLTFVHHHYTGNVGEIICNQLDVLFNDGVYDLLPFDDMKGNSSKKMVGLTDSMTNIRTENAKIRQLYCRFPDSFLYNFPMIIGQGFIDSLIQKLRNLTEKMISDLNHVHFAKYKMKTIEEELLSLTPIFNQILELKDLNDAWLEVVNVLYLAEHVISMCFIFYHLIWHYIPYLSQIVDRIKVVRTRFVEGCKMYNNSRSIPHSSGRMSTLLEHDRNSEMVGFEEDKRIIIDNITRGTKSLDIVSVVGMGGLGKTTLAKQVYGSSSVKSHFNIFAFTYVSQDHDKKRLLLDILRDIVEVDAKTSCMTEDDLAHKLKKCLSRQKYFVVLDDIWNINAWDEIRSSFPDDRNGSRVMFTTRSLEVAKRGQIKCTPHQLCFLTEDESWKLIRRQLFHNGMPPPNLFGVVQLVAKKCNGLPLAIVVIAGLLTRTETSHWFEISKSVSSHLFDEGCMDVLELSYKHLPEYLKPCLLYLGAFPEGGSYKVRHVTMLWIAEGFVKESKTKSLNDVAKEYFHELVDRSLIIVDEMIIGEINTFRVHGLIHDFCQKKCADKNFFKRYRVSAQKLHEPSFRNTHSLLYFPSQFDYSQKIFPLKKFIFAKVLYLKGIQLHESDFAHVTSLVDVRHIEAEVFMDRWIPSSISNLWNLQSLILKSNDRIYLPETLWRMRSLRHVKVSNCKFEGLDGDELNAYPRLDKVVSFSRPYLSSGKDVEWLLQRLPAIRELDCILQVDPLDSTERRVETFDFHRKLESLKLLQCKRKIFPYLIKFPSTLIKLTLAGFELSSPAISAIAELQCLRILKLRRVFFPEKTWEMDDLTFPNLKYFELCRSNLEVWNASIDSFPCLEELYFYRTLMEMLPLCFGEISSLKKITIWGPHKLTSSALWLQDEHMDLGNKVELVGVNI